MSMRPTSGIATDASQLTTLQITEYQGIDLNTGERIFRSNIGFQTVNIGEFLAVVDAIKYIIETDYQPRVIYTDSTTAIAWIKNKRTASKKANSALQKAEIFLKAFADDVSTIEIKQCKKAVWG